VGNQIALSCAVLVLAFAAVARSQGLPSPDEIRAGRQALESGHPKEARAHFAAALAQASREDRFVALIGLGRADLWLGHYRAAAADFRGAREAAGSEIDRHVAETGLARALNSLEYYRQAYALVAPFAKGDLGATVELLRAANGTGRFDEAAPYIATNPSADDSTRLGQEFLRQKDDISLQLSKRLDAELLYSDDSDGLNVRTYSLGTWLPGTASAQVFETWHLNWASTSVEAGGSTDQLTQVDLGGAARIGATQHLGALIGAGSVNGWEFAEGSLEWETQLSDSAAVDASLERAPILTTLALADRLLFNTYTLGASARLSDHWSVVPVYFHQEFSDGNRRDGGHLKIVLSPYDIPNTTSALGAQIDIRGYSSTAPSTGIYFNPAHYLLVRAGVIAAQQLSVDWRLRLVAGVGSETIDGASTSSYAWDLSLQGRLPANGRLVVHLGRDSFASMAGGGPGYWNNTATLSVVYPF
jgi:tetratricopeptide (TPR) repeat protein